MADDNSPAPPPPPKPTPKTSTVPLKKETVRITLRAKPASGDTATVPSVAPMEQGADDDATATAPVGADDATSTAPVAPPAPGGPPPAAPPPPGGAKTIPLAKAPAPPGGQRPAAGAKTIPLAKAPGVAGAPAGARTTPLQPAAGGAVKPLPKATVQLQKTQPMVGGSPTAAIQRGPATGLATATTLQAAEETDEETGIMPYAIIVLLLAIIVLAIELLTKFTPS